MPENETNDELLATLRAQRDSLEKQIEKLEGALEICNDAIAEQELNLSGKRVAKGRITSVVKQYMLEHGGADKKTLRKHVIDHGGVRITDDFDKRFSTSLTRCVTENTMVESNGVYDLSERERKRLIEEGE